MTVGVDTQKTVAKLFNPGTRLDALNAFRADPELLKNEATRRALYCAFHYFEPEDVESAQKLLGLEIVPA